MATHPPTYTITNDNPPTESDSVSNPMVQQEQHLLTFRPPSTIPSTQSSPPFTPPTPTWLTGPWQISHSTLPMWKSKRNVTITYSLLPTTSSSSHPPGTFSNVVSSLPLHPPSKKNNKKFTVCGIEKPDPKFPGAWNWRGRKGLVESG